jgi:hypothetical protein
MGASSIGGVISQIVVLPPKIVKAHSNIPKYTPLLANIEW